MGLMNKILLILAVATLAVSCKKEEINLNNIQKYPNGTVLYAKPDSLKVVTVHFDAYDNTYKVYWRDRGEYHTDWFNETSFYGEVESEPTYE
jgi:hypothetical protein